MLTVDREAYWARFIGREPGTPGPDMLAWCRSAQSDDTLVLIEFALHLEREGETCALVVYGDAPRRLRQELRDVVALWKPDRRGFWLDKQHKLTTKFFDHGDRSDIAIHWRSYLELDALVGTTGKLLRDVDIERLAGRPATHLQRYVRPPFRVSRTATRPATPLRTQRADPAGLRAPR
jgi:hypothetical protein